MPKLKQNIIFISLILIATVLISLFGAMRDTGGTAVVSVADGDTVKLSLAKSGVYNIDGGKLPVIIEIAEGKARFINSVCPDHICEGFGWISKEADKATCAPARVVLTVE